MKAKELAKLLLMNPDFEVQCTYVDTTKEGPWPAYNILTITDVADVGYSSKIIVLATESINPYSEE